jgi:hypothetical protein
MTGNDKKTDADSKENLYYLSSSKSSPRVLYFKSSQQKQYLRFKV